MTLYFSDYFEVPRNTLTQYGAFDISLVTDLPLFIDPFLLFTSEDHVYRNLHDSIIEYLKFLRDKSIKSDISKGNLQSWFFFSEVKQNYLGFTAYGNTGRGLGNDFAQSLYHNLSKVFSSFGEEKISRGTHLEKLCLIRGGVGRDTISDFTTNLIKEYLLSYTQEFTLKYIAEKYRTTFAVRKVHFNYVTETWEPKSFILPIFNGDYVLLTPIDILTKDDIWINRTDLMNSLNRIAAAVPNDQLRAELNNYLTKALAEHIGRSKLDKWMNEFLTGHPEMLEYYIKDKEDKGDQAVEQSFKRVQESRILYNDQFGALVTYLISSTDYFRLTSNTETEASTRIQYLKHVIENQGGWRVFYVDGEPFRREEDLHIFFLFTWCGTISDVSHEVNDGRGPVDFKISRGSADKTLVEFKLASNSQLKRNLQHQVELYKQASGARIGFKVIFYFSVEELKKVNALLKELNLINDKYVILIDGRKDNKSSASIATSH